MPRTFLHSRKSRAQRAGKDWPQRLREEDDESLSPAMIRELERRLRDARDPVRYMLVSEFGRRSILYYNVSDNVFAMNNPSGGTLFKRREAAVRVRQLLGKRISIVKFTTEGGKLKRLSPHRDRWTKRRGAKA